MQVSSAHSLSHEQMIKSEWQRLDFFTSLGPSFPSGIHPCDIVRTNVAGIHISDVSFHLLWTLIHFHQPPDWNCKAVDIPTDTQPRHGGEAHQRRGVRCQPWPKQEAEGDRLFGRRPQSPGNCDLTVGTMWDIRPDLYTKTLAAILRVPSSPMQSWSAGAKSGQYTGSNWRSAVNISERRSARSSKHFR